MKSFWLAALITVSPLAVEQAVAQAPAPAQSFAPIPLPRLKPEPPRLSEYISNRDAALLRRGLSAASRGDWGRLKDAKEAINDDTARNILFWVRAARDPHVPTDWLTYVTHELRDWPRMVSIQAKAEARLLDRPLSARDTVRWFEGLEPVSGEGRAALAKALFRLGDRANGDIWLKKAWREARLTRDTQRDLFQAYRSHFTPADHAARADHLIWQGSSHFSKAQALLPHMGQADRAVMDARMKLARRSRGVNRAVAAVPQARLTDPGFLFERARWRRKQHNYDHALPVYLQIESAPVGETAQRRMWIEKRLMIYWLLSENKFAEAYRLTNHNGAQDGLAFYEPEFLGGWIALTKLGRPDIALARFQRLEAGVDTPISLARSLYWQGRAHEALKNGQHSAAYAKAAVFPNTYYGQLATKRLQGPNAQLSLPPQHISPDLRSRFVADRRVRALKLLGEAGEERFFSTFAYALDDQLQSLDELALLSQLSAEYGFMRPSIRAAKQAGRFQSLLSENGYPIVPPIEALGPTFDIPFVYAIARQESEFAANAISSARAYGMMQMIDATARATARRHRIPYDRNRLITDRDYAARMGALHIHDLLEDYDGS
ncbi:MAG: lytic transglycosylase domain-containing protein, partial [Pseudomonadota bacterium]